MRLTLRLVRPAHWPLLRGRRYLLALATSTLSVTVLLKLGEIQYLEILLAADFLVLLILFFRERLRANIFQPFFQIGLGYTVFLIAAFFLALLALRSNFYPYQFTALKRPMLVTLSRMAEMFIDVFYMLYMASIYRKDEKLCAFGARSYYWIGIAGCVYALATFPLNYFYGMQLGTYLVTHRLRGFNNEGGSYGTYLITTILLAVAMYRRGWLTSRQFCLGMVLLLINFAGSQSKAAFFALAIIAVFHMIWIYSGIRRILIIASVCAAFAAIAALIDLPRQLQVYVRASAQYQKLSNLKAMDGNYVAGRIAGAVLAPRMIQAHPLAGIGWGNYTLVRDDPEYRRGTAYSILKVDAPGLGPIDYIVELGIPLWVYLTLLGFLPVYLLRRHHADPWLMDLALMQPVANWFGAHLNITYQWVILGLALGIGFSKRLASPELPEP